MLTLHHDGHSVTRLPCRTSITVSSEAPPSTTDGDDLQIHVTSVVATQELACRFLDAAARTAFTTLDLMPNNIEVVQSAAGSGKSTANIKLAKHLLSTNQIEKALIIAFNRQAVIDGTARTRDEPRIHWRTLDSLVFELYKAELDGKDGTDLDDIPSIAKMATQVLDMPVYNDEAEEFADRLKKACENGNGQRLFRESRTIFQAGLRGDWWCYSLLRIRALENPAWRTSLASYPVVFVDEAQDLTYPMYQLMQQLHPGKHFIYSMDCAQKLYSFMNCIDILKHMQPRQYRHWRFYLTFRHGQRICDYVNERSLPGNHTYAAAGTPDTQISFVDDDDDVSGVHTYIVSSWRNILEIADRLLNAGRLVRIDTVKRTELLDAAKATGWTKHDKALFKRMNRDFVYDICSRMQSDFKEENEVFLTTVHSFKGLESPVVRVSRCVMSAKPRAGEFDDIPHKVYVAVTRAQEHLYLPGLKSARNKKW